MSMEFYSNLDSRLLDRQTPTIFEIISAEELENLLSPSIRYVLAYYATRHPRHLIKILNHFGSLNLLIRGLIEYRVLRTWNSTFIEKFYGLKRVNRPAIGEWITKSISDISPRYEKLRRLKKKQIWGTLLELLLVPYIKEKLDVLYEHLLPEYLLNKLKPRESIKDFIRYSFVRLYPKVELTLRILDIVYKILFISGRTKSASLLQQLFGIQYARFSSYDYQLNEKRVSKYLSSPIDPTSRVRPESSTESLLRMYSKFVRPLKKTLLFGADTVLPASIFILKFLEWWNSSDAVSNFKNDKKEKKTPKLPSLLPNSMLEDKGVAGQLATTNDTCRICHEAIKNPAIIETGYVFCYPCIYNFLKDGDKSTGGRCPVTGKKLLGCKYSDTMKEWKVTGIRRLII
ncbi:hypothetical protein BRETT_004492 [Brettanomyces bruxellensis]|uniref:Peroxisome assembly protein 12 n=1 Tax=Dekkera bruxellensis TaxID=5007 RepID=A0A871R9I3_DEKBR|nr:uncharacterized protein BRETT_004492 [Brettanomyces bruxellensis]QOU19271.1 hypothetical protein BRETT_004492 [Brettanomyces bruxellensis]